jgi:hypothetical protein
MVMRIMRASYNRRHLREENAAFIVEGGIIT